MEGKGLPRGWAEVVEQHRRWMGEWRKTHPRATFAEIEQAVEGQLDELRAAWVQELVDVEAAEPTGTVICPTCGQSTESRGHKERTITVRGERSVRLRRRYVRCPGCGAGLFPPR